MEEKILSEVIAEEKSAEAIIKFTESDFRSKLISKKEELGNKYNQKLSEIKSECSFEKEELVKKLQSKFNRKKTSQSKNLSVYDSITQKRAISLAKKVLVLISK